MNNDNYEYDDRPYYFEDDVSYLLDEGTNCRKRLLEVKTNQTNCKVPITTDLSTLSIETDSIINNTIIESNDITPSHNKTVEQLSSNNSPSINALNNNANDSINNIEITNTPPKIPDVAEYIAISELQKRIEDNTGPAIISKYSEIEISTIQRIKEALAPLKFDIFSFFTVLKITQEKNYVNRRDITLFAICFLFDHPENYIECFDKNIFSYNAALGSAYTINEFIKTVNAFNNPPN